MLPESTIAALARQLYDARKSRTPLRHFSQQHPSMTIDDGYAIQRAWVALEIADGRRIKGRKIGLTSRAMQQASQITEPDYAPLMDDMFFAQGSDIPRERFIAPRVEVELAFILGRPLRGPGVTLFDVLAATDYVTPAIEIRILEYNDKHPKDATTNSSPRIGAEQVARYRRDLQSVFNAIVLRPPRCTALTKSERDPSTPDSTIGWWIDAERLRDCTAHRCVAHDSYL